jgi:hypothetical protein
MLGSQGTRYFFKLECVALESLWFVNLEVKFPTKIPLSFVTTHLARGQLAFITQNNLFLVGL